MGNCDSIYKLTEFGFSLPEPLEVASRGVHVPVPDLLEPLQAGKVPHRPHEAAPPPAGGNRGGGGALLKTKVGRLLCSQEFLFCIDCLFAAGVTLLHVELQRVDRLEDLVALRTVIRVFAAVCPEVGLKGETKCVRNKCKSQ